MVTITRTFSWRRVGARDRCHRYSNAAVESLRIAEREFPEAHLAIADVLMHQGSLAAAREEVEKYLRTKNPEHKPLAEAWLRMLTID